MGSEVLCNSLVVGFLELSHLGLITRFNQTLEIGSEVAQKGPSNAGRVLAIQALIRQRKAALKVAG